MSLQGKADIRKLREAGRRRGFWKHGFDLERHAAQVFGDVRLQGKRVLEIGSGRGVFSMCAGIEGAQCVIGLEPMAAGFYDAKDFLAGFHGMVSELGLSNVDVDAHFVQEYNPPKADFDVVLSVHSLNHLNEDACIRLHKDPDARHTYFTIFRKIRSLMAPGGKFIAIDCSSHTLLSDLGARNPFNPDIDWRKHQPARTWREVLEEAGFANTTIKYAGNTFIRYLRIKYVPLAMSYCMDGIFRIEATAV